MSSGRAGALENLSLAEQEGNQEPPHPPVAVDERVDGFELSVGEPAVHEDRQWGRVVQERFEVVERRVHLVNRRRNEDGGVQVATIRRPDPVLSPSKLARSLFTPLERP